MNGPHIAQLRPAACFWYWPLVSTTPTERLADRHTVTDRQTDEEMNDMSVCNRDMTPVPRSNIKYMPANNAHISIFFYSFSFSYFAYNLETWKTFWPSLADRQHHSDRTHTLRNVASHFFLGGSKNKLGAAAYVAVYIAKWQMLEMAFVGKGKHKFITPGPDFYVLACTVHILPSVVTWLQWRSRMNKFGL